MEDSKDRVVGFEDIYESIVAYEYEIKSLCDMILTEIAANDSLNDELTSYQISNDDFRNQLKSLQVEYDQVIDNLHDKEYSLVLSQQKQNDLMDVLNEYEMAQKQNQ